MEEVQNTLSKVSTAKTQVVGFVQTVKKVVTSVQSFFEKIKDIIAACDVPSARPRAAPRTRKPAGQRLCRPAPGLFDPDGDRATKAYMKRALSDASGW